MSNSAQQHDDFVQLNSRRKLLGLRKFPFLFHPSDLEMMSQGNLGRSLFLTPAGKKNRINTVNF